MDPQTYLGEVRNYRSLMRSLAEEARVDAEYTRRLTEAAERTGAEHASLMTEDWCGDSACNVPILARLFADAGLPFRIVRGSELEELKNRYESEGDDHIPVVSIWRADGTELARWIEAPEAVEERKKAWKAERPHFEQLYERRKTGDREAAKEFGTLYRKFLEEMAGWYRDGMWAETTREVVEALEQAQ